MLSNQGPTSSFLEKSGWYPPPPCLPPGPAVSPGRGGRVCARSSRGRRRAPWCLPALDPPWVSAPGVPPACARPYPNCPSGGDAPPPQHASQAQRGQGLGSCDRILLSASQRNQSPWGLCFNEARPPCRRLRVPGRSSPECGAPLGGSVDPQLAPHNRAGPPVGTPGDIGFPPGPAKNAGSQASAAESEAVAGPGWGLGRCVGPALRQMGGIRGGRPSWGGPPSHPTLQTPAVRLAGSCRPGPGSWRYSPSILGFAS